LKKVRHAATIADCDCWVLPTARLDARIVIAALGSPSTEDDRPSYPDHADMSCDER
jgi:hypothetical protein